MGSLYLFYSSLKRSSMARVNVGWHSLPATHAFMHEWDEPSCRWWVMLCWWWWWCRWWWFWWRRMLNGQSSTRGHYSRRCHTCCVLVMAAIRLTVLLTYGWRWSVWLPVQRAMRCSSVIRLPSFSHSTLPRDSTAKRSVNRIHSKTVIFEYSVAEIFQ